MYSIRAGLIFPVSLGEKIDLINRWFLPFVFQEASFPGDTNSVGLSDLNLQALLTPKEPRWFLWGEFKWGLGTSVFIPTNTDDQLGTDKISIGPLLAFVRRPRALVYGFLLQNVWSVAKCNGASMPLRRVGKPEEIAHAIHFLLTNTYTTGITLRVDGGALLI